MRRTMLLLTVMAATLVLASGVALAVARSGGPGDDTLRGSNGADALSGNGGDDDLLGLGGRDALSGGEGRDAVLGGNEAGPKGGDKSLAGGPGGDFVGGGRGEDALSGGPGGDFMFAGPPFGEAADDVDAIAAGDGRDAVLAINRPASRDIIDCGGGFDRALVDKKDVTSDCEREFTSARKFFRSINGEDYFQPLNSL
ncbi:MAG: hypothetical protein M3N33_02655 [Actinomycetota bacterium]|nr:hypothetical protein [Actinomycetota bacterium]